MREVMKKTYSTEMFEYLVRGEKIAIFCSMINRIKYKIKDLVEWEYSDRLDNNEISLADFEFIIKNEKMDKSIKNPICIKFNVDSREADEYFESMRNHYDIIGSMNICEKEKTKMMNDWFCKNRKFKEVDEERQLCESFKLKQVFMVKII
jgi:hypothetical protein